MHRPCSFASEFSVARIRVVCAACDEYDAAILGHMVEQQLHEEEVAQVVGCKRVLVPVYAIGNLPQEIRPCIADDCVQRIDLSARNHSTENSSRAPNRRERGGVELERTDFDPVGRFQLPGDRLDAFEVAAR